MALSANICCSIWYKQECKDVLQRLNSKLKTTFCTDHKLRLGIVIEIETDWAGIKMTYLIPYK